MIAVIVKSSAVITIAAVPAVWTRALKDNSDSYISDSSSGISSSSLCQTPAVEAEDTGGLFINLVIKLSLRRKRKTTERNTLVIFW